MHSCKRSKHFARTAQRFSLRTTGLLVLAVLSFVGFTWAATKEVCQKTYLIQPGAKKIVAQIKLRELSENERQSVEHTAKSKYAETQQSPHKFTPLGEMASRKTNCAGYIMTKLFPSTFKQGNIDPDAFYNLIVKPLGLQIASTKNSDIKDEIANVKTNDIVVYLRGNKANHVALATGPLVADPLLDNGIPILSKDGEERPYQGFLSWIGGGAFGMTTMHERDPLVQAHAAPNADGSVEIHRINPERIDLHAVSPRECDTDWAGNTWTGFRGRSKYDIRLTGDVLAISWTTDSKPEGEYYDCKLSGEALEIADCKWKQVGGTGGTVHLTFKEEAAGDRISGQMFDGKNYWDVDIWRER